MRKQALVIVSVLLATMMLASTVSAIGMYRGSSASKFALKRTTPATCSIVGNYTGIFRQEGTRAQRPDAPWDKMTNLGICFLIAKVVDGKPTLAYENSRTTGSPRPGDDDAARIDKVVKMARAKNKNIKIALVLTYSDATNEAMLTNPAVFAQSVVDFVRKHKVDGFEMDYEGSATMSTAQLTSLVPVIRKALDDASTDDKRIDPYMFNLDWDTLSGFTGELVNNNYDLCLFQYYGRRRDQVEGWVKEATDIGVDPRILVAGNCIESGYTNKWEFTVSEAKRLKLAGVFEWRIDSDDPDKRGYPQFTYLKKMWDAMHASAAKNNRSNSSGKLHLR